MEDETQTTQNQKAGSVPEIAVRPEDFDISRVVIHDPTTFTSKADVTTTTSRAFYLDDNNVECILYIPAPEQSSFGPQYVYDMGLAEEEQTPDKAKGMQIMYQCTSLATVAEPTPAEQAYIDCINALRDLAIEKGKEEAEREVALVPDVAVNSFIAAEKKKNYNLAVKPVFEHPKGKDKKTLDVTKPLRQYIKLVTDGQGPKMVVKTPFYGPGDKKMNAVRYVGQRGNITPCLRFDGLFWGAHGKNPHGCSLRFKVVEANFIPQNAGAGLPTHRILGKNMAPAEDDTSVVREEGDDEGFEAPGGDATNPSRALEAAARPKAKVAPKAKAVAPKAKVAPKVVAKAVAKAAKPAPKVVVKAIAKKAAPKVVAKATPKPKPAPVVEDVEEDTGTGAEEDVEEDAGEDAEE